jgi:PAS domain-containing protein
MVIRSCHDITERKLSELALQEQLKFETVLAGLLTTFINLPPTQLDGQIIEAQKRICETLGLDRSTLGQATAEGDNLIITHSWAAEGFKVGRRLNWPRSRILSGCSRLYSRDKRYGGDYL